MPPWVAPRPVELGWAIVRGSAWGARLGMAGGAAGAFGGAIIGAMVGVAIYRNYM